MHGTYIKLAAVALTLIHTRNKNLLEVQVEQNLSIQLVALGRAKGPVGVSIMVPPVTRNDEVS